MAGQGWPPKKTSEAKEKIMGKENERKDKY